MATSQSARPVRVVPPQKPRLPEPSSFTSNVRGTRVSAILGVALGVAFGICFLTGLASHLVQHPQSWLEWPARPVNLYRWVTATHTTTGVASVALLVAKLWASYPALWKRPIFRNLPHAVERVSLIPLVGGSILLLADGMADHFYWYANPRSFTPTHYWLAWITMGALLVHVGAKIKTTRQALRGETP